MKSTPFFQKWALVTGASSGIGKAIAVQLAAEKANLILISRSETVLVSLANQLETDYQVKVLCFPIDLSLPGTSAKIEKFCQEKGINVSILVNNAGYAIRTEDEIKSPQKVSEMLQILVGNLTELSLRFLPGMINAGEGYLLNVSSIVAYIPVASTLTYHAAKVYVLAFTRALHWEYAHKGIHITCSLPGATKTGFSSASDLYVPDHLWKQYGSSESVAKASLEALKKNRCTVIPGWNNRGLFWLSRIIPHYWIFSGQKSTGPVTVLRNYLTISGLPYFSERDFRKSSTTLLFFSFIKASSAPVLASS